MVSMQNLPQSTQSLPFHGKRIFHKYYVKSLNMNISTNDAAKVAWSAVRRKYYKSGGLWVPFVDDNEFDTTSCSSDDSESCYDN
ncbi:ChaB2 [Apocheima cinerarium nucleopolyhedrovirus]|uniref:ChaB2 n=1 Tax=Apocheima cinerarium nucleopolyhedrovirus TaxID=307461 RepID=UPI0001D92056|nr:ChaB2 [Apocheima cinerarium nucleopolyhedrovirus]ADB84394.1 ChaB2 [Apocheima cinerarium nucleopolyhedrovirus]